ncbi:MAG: hypothetical protein LUG99_11120 [Lachnospiraceae bacterium]|nr:hypothetical protein [Lachnospiraceae bacterium]
MCANGVNTEQFLQMIDMLDDHIALEYRWSHRLAHTAGDGGYAATSEKLHTAQAMLADVRSLLDEAKESFEADALTAGADKTTVRLV